MTSKHNISAGCSTSWSRTKLNVVDRKIPSFSSSKHMQSTLCGVQVKITIKPAKYSNVRLAIYSHRRRHTAAWLYTFQLTFICLEEARLFMYTLLAAYSRALLTITINQLCKLFTSVGKLFCLQSTCKHTWLYRDTYIAPLMYIEYMARLGNLNDRTSSLACMSPCTRKRTHTHIHTNIIITHTLTKQHITITCTHLTVKKICDGTLD